MIFSGTKRLGNQAEQKLKQAGPSYYIKPSYMFCKHSTTEYPPCLYCLLKYRKSCLTTIEKLFDFCIKCFKNCPCIRKLSIQKHTIQSINWLIKLTDNNENTKYNWATVLNVLSILSHQGKITAIIKESKS